MNILSLIFAVLLMLALFTQTQMENFTRFTIIKKEYDNYTKDRARIRFNERQEALFDSGSQTEKSKRNKRSYCRRINFRLILDKKIRESDDNKYQQHRLAVKELIRILYRHTEFYQLIESNRPNFIDEMLDGLIAAAKGKKIQYVEDVEKLNLHDDELQDVLYKILSGTEKKVVEEKKEPSLRVNNKSTNQDVEEIEENEDPGEEPEEDFQADKRYITLKDFIHLRPNQRQIQIYLAPKEILLALFEDEETVNQIIEMREMLFRKKENEGIALQQLSEFKSKLKPGIKEDILYFGVSQTNPKDYK